MSYPIQFAMNCCKNMNAVPERWNNWNSNYSMMERSWTSLDDLLTSDENPFAIWHRWVWKLGAWLKNQNWTFKTSSPWTTEEAYELIWNEYVTETAQAQWWWASNWTVSAYWYSKRTTVGWSQFKAQMHFILKISKVLFLCYWAKMN